MSIINKTRAMLIKFLDFLLLNFLLYLNKTKSPMISNIKPTKKKILDN